MNYNNILKTQEKCISVADSWGMFGDGGSDAVKQLTKTFEELSELAGNLCIEDRCMNCVEDDIGDTTVCMVNACVFLGTKFFPEEDTFEQILEHFKNTDQNFNTSSEFRALWLVAQVGELLSCVIKGKDIDLIDIKLDCVLIAIMMLCKSLDVDLHNCFAGSVDVISKRKGKFINGFFVKSEDL